MNWSYIETSRIRFFYLFILSTESRALITMKLFVCIVIQDSEFNIKWTSLLNSQNMFTKGSVLLRWIFATNVKRFIGELNINRLEV